VTVLLIAILGTTLMNSVNMGGGIGLAYTSMTLIGFLGIFACLSVSGGICGGALRCTNSLVTQVSNINAKENNIGSRQLSYIAKSMNIFITVIAGVLMVGYYMTIKEQQTISFFDYEFFGSWIFGGAYFFLLSSLILGDVEAATVKLDEQY
jgi:hypothetical protein